MMTLIPQIQEVMTLFMVVFTLAHVAILVPLMLVRQLAWYTWSKPVQTYDVNLPDGE